MSSSHLVKRHCTDVIPFDSSPSSESNLDVLSLPLYGPVTNKVLSLNSSKFKDVSFYIPTVSENDVLHGQDLQVLDSSDSDTGDDDESASENYDDDSSALDQTESVAEKTEQLLHRSWRTQKPSIKFLQMVADS